MAHAWVIDKFKELQDEICAALESCDGKSKFEEDIWNHEHGGGGRTRVIQKGNVFEKGGVNFSAVEGVLPPVVATHLGVTETKYFATGVSIVIHPSHPLVPIIHMNVRYFELEDGRNWFGGGIDLTPIYIDDAEAKYFHQALKETCDRHDDGYYATFKKWADDYFFIPHRNETRGVGGIFFDHLEATKSRTREQLLAFVLDVGRTFAPTYLKIVNDKKHLPFSEDQKQWQAIRRGRYVEFNLVYDRGTKFGLETSGRIESILMSLPDVASWKYNYVPKKSSPEAHTQSLLRKEINWVRA